MIDLRSDTVTRPTRRMREVIAGAMVGDDVYGDDPTINELEKKSADMLGKEAALFVSSGTMGNQLSIMAQTNRGDEIIAGKKSHIFCHEVGATAVLSGVTINTIDNRDTKIYEEDVIRNVRPVDIHEPRTSLLCLENALANGTVVSLGQMQGLYRTAKKLGLNVHLDGARIFNAAAALDIDARAIADCSDTVTFCLSKGLCAPVGSLLLGSQRFVDRARKLRKMIGGGMRQIGFLGVCGLVALREMRGRLKVDHDNAKFLAKELNKIDGFHVVEESVQINMVFATVSRKGFDSDRFVKYLLKNDIKLNGAERNSEGVFELRFVTSNDVNREDLEKVLDIVARY